MDLQEIIKEAVIGLTSGKEILEKTGVGDLIKSGIKSLQSFIKNLFSKNKAASQALANLEKAPSDQINTGMLMAFLQNELDASDDKIRELEAILVQLKTNLHQDDAAKIIIKNSKNIVYGGMSNIQGNVHIGDVQ